MNDRKKARERRELVTLIVFIVIGLGVGLFVYATFGSEAERRNERRQRENHERAKEQFKNMPDLTRDMSVNSPNEALIEQGRQRLEQMRRDAANRAAARVGENEVGR